MHDAGWASKAVCQLSQAQDISDAHRQLFLSIVYSIYSITGHKSHINVMLAGDQELQQLASGLLTDRAELSCPDSVLQALRNMPGSSLLAWTLCPHLTAAVLPADGPEPETQNSLADAYELCR